MLLLNKIVVTFYKQISNFIKIYNLLFKVGFSYESKKIW